LGSPVRPQPWRRTPRTDWGGLDADVVQPLQSARRWRIGKLVALGALALLVIACATMFFQRPQIPVFRGDVELVDFDSEPLEQSFVVNSVYGNNPYTIAKVGVAGTRGLDLDDSTASESTLVFTKKAYDLSKIASLEVSCLFRRQAIGAGSHAINLGLVETTGGRLSGVKGDGYFGLWLRVEGESLRMQFQTKGPADARPRTGPLSDEFITEEGKWYQFKATFVRVSDEGIRVLGEISKASAQGEVGSQVASLSPRVFWIKDFVIQQLIDDHELWVAIRANGAGGADAIDNLRIAARSLPPKPATPTSPASPSARLNSFYRIPRNSEF
jgi:hypothetical protein